jgi:hypothetical protein
MLYNQKQQENLFKLIKSHIDYLKD